MFEINKIQVVPNKQAFEPAFGITVQYQYDKETKLPLKFNGHLLLDNLHVIGYMTEYSARGGSKDEVMATSFQRDEPVIGRQSFVVPISRIVLSKLEERRNTNPKHDLQFSVKLEVTCVESSFGLALNAKTNTVDIVKVEHGTLFWFKTYLQTEQVTISRGDWISDFYSFFENRKYQVFELPIPNLNNKSGALNEKINVAIESLNMLDAARSAGDWNRVIQESRPIWELIRDKPEIEKLLIEADMDQSAIDAFVIMIDKLFDFASKFIHKIGHKTTKMMQKNNASKEDAELIYSLSFTVVNLIATKLAKKV